MIIVKRNNKSRKLHLILLILFILAYLVSAIKPRSYFIWFYESFPAAVGVLILIFTYKKFRFTSFVYVLILLTTIIMLIGAHYKYDNVPLFGSIKNLYGLKRNYYDRLGHFMQGFVPAFIVREALIRKFKFKKIKMLPIFVVCICLSISAFYEIIEAGIGIISGKSAEEFLGLQGDILDTQWDMLMSLIGSLIAVLIFYKIHDRHIYRLKVQPK